MKINPRTLTRLRVTAVALAPVAALALWSPGTAAASARIDGCVSTIGGVADYDRDGHQDIVVRKNDTGDLWLYPGESRRGYSNQTPVKIGNGWSDSTVADVADYDRDGHQDIVARKDTTGDLWLYPGESRRGYSNQTPVKIGNGWSDATFAGIADYDRDGHQDIVSRKDPTGDLWLYPGESRRGYPNQTPVKIGNGWGDAVLDGIADWDRDGHQDIVTTNISTGDLWLYPGASRRGYSNQTPVKIGNGWC